MSTGNCFWNDTALSYKATKTTLFITKNKVTFPCSLTQTGLCCFMAFYRRTTSVANRERNIQPKNM